jgi:hypothetical protein
VRPHGVEPLRSHTSAAVNTCFWRRFACDRGGQGGANQSHSG